jgi:hypothetical protein
VVAKARERTSVNKEAMQEFYVKVLSLKELNEVEFREAYQLKT